MGKPAVLLFDIDGTLVDCGGVGRRAMEQSFELLHGRPDAVSHVAFGGMTDPAIIRLGLVQIGVEPEPEAIERMLSAYLDALSSAMSSAGAFRVLTNVPETLDDVARSGHFVGLGTGNVKRGAELKLSHAGLWTRFSFGGYACDAEERAEVLRQGRSRGVALAGGSPRVVVIGDTPHDVTAARAIGAECLAVATGRSSVADLVAAGPTLAVPDLADPRVGDFLG